MKRKYYLRGLGLGILITSIVFIVAGPKELSDEEIINRAVELGYVKGTESSLGIKDLLNKETPVPTKPVYTVEIPGENRTPSPTPTVKPTETVTPIPTATPTPVPTSEPVATNTPVPTETPTPTPTFTPTPSPTEIPEKVVKATIKVERGNSASMVCEKMEQAGIVKDGSDFRKYLISRGLTDFINIGTYELSSDMSYKELAKIITGQ